MGRVTPLTSQQCQVTYFSLCSLKPNHVVKGTALYFAKPSISWPLCAQCFASPNNQMNAKCCLGVLQVLLFRCLQTHFQLSRAFTCHTLDFIEAIRCKGGWTWLSQSSLKGLMWRLGGPNKSFPTAVLSANFLASSGLFYINPFWERHSVNASSYWGQEKWSASIYGQNKFIMWH